MMSRLTIMFLVLSTLVCSQVPDIDFSDEYIDNISKISGDSNRSGCFTCKNEDEITLVIEDELDQHVEDLDRQMKSLSDSLNKSLHYNGPSKSSDKSVVSFFVFLIVSGSLVFIVYLYKNGLVN